MKTMKRLPIAVLFGIASLAVGSAAWAEPSAEPRCNGHHDGHEKGARFQRADKNGDGFLTRDEVSAERWERIKVADANGDAKISRDELREAYQSGKLGHHSQKSQH